MLALSSVIILTVLHFFDHDLLRINGMFSVTVSGLILDSVSAMITGKTTLLMAVTFWPSENLNEVMDGKASISFNVSSVVFVLNVSNHFSRTTVFVQAVSII